MPLDSCEIARQRRRRNFALMDRCARQRQWQAAKWLWRSPQHPCRPVRAHFRAADRPRRRTSPVNRRHGSTNCCCRTGARPPPPRAALPDDGGPATQCMVRIGGAHRMNSFQRQQRPLHMQKPSHPTGRFCCRIGLKRPANHDSVLAVPTSGDGRHDGAAQSRSGAAVLFIRSG